MIFHDNRAWIKCFFCRSLVCLTAYRIFSTLPLGGKGVLLFFSVLDLSRVVTNFVELFPLMGRIFGFRTGFFLCEMVAAKLGFD